MLPALLSLSLCAQGPTGTAHAVVTAPVIDGRLNDPAWRDVPPITGFIQRDRKSTRLNSSHSQISYAVFCLKKKKTTVGNFLEYERVRPAHGVVHVIPPAAHW